MALFHFKRTRAADLLADQSTLRVKPDTKLLRVGGSLQTSCPVTSWSEAAEQERGGVGGGGIKSFCMMHFWFHQIIIFISVLVLVFQYFYGSPSDRAIR